MTVLYIFCDNFAKIKLSFLKYDEIMYSYLYLCIYDYIRLPLFWYPLLMSGADREFKTIFFSEKILYIFASIACEWWGEDEWRVLFLSLCACHGISCYKRILYYLLDFCICRNDRSRSITIVYLMIFMEYDYDGRIRSREALWFFDFSGFDGSFCLPKSPRLYRIAHPIDRIRIF